MSQYTHMKNTCKAYVVSFSTHSVAAQLDILKTVRTHTSHRCVEQETLHAERT